MPKKMAFVDSILTGTLKALLAIFVSCPSVSALVTHLKIRGKGNFFIRTFYNSLDVSIPVT